MEWDPLFQDADWYRALTLLERRDLCAPSPFDPNQAGFDATVAAKRLARRRTQAPLQDEVPWQKRLASEHFCADRFEQVLGTAESVLAEQDQSRPDWLLVLEDAFRSFPDMALPPALEQARITNPTLGFLVPVAPLLQSAITRVKAGLKEMAASFPGHPLDLQTTAGLLLANLPEHLIGMLNRTLILELHVAGMRGNLSGEDPKARFAAFIQRLRNPSNALALLKEYAVLARHLVVTLDQRVRFGLELCRRLCRDRRDLEAQFGVADLGRLTAFKMGAGDQHHDGRSVVILAFSSGFQVVYKPRSLAVEHQFQQLLEQLNRWGAEPPLRTMTVLDRGDYGWVEFVAAEPCSDSAQAARFYRRQGSLLALLYGLQATDFHYENLIAAGEHPVLIDLESLFHPHVGAPEHDGRSQLMALQAMNYSVLRIGLLPNRFFSDQEQSGIDLSGMAAKDGQMSPRPVPVPAGEGTDDMRIVHRHVMLPGAENQARLEGKALNPLDYADDIKAGFAAMYRLLLLHRPVLLAENGPLAAFAETRIRVILRPTRVYGLFLRDALHPDLLRDGLARDAFFDRLWANIDENPALATVISHERCDLQRGDVPMFTTKAASRVLWNADGGVVSEDFLEEAPLLRVQRGLTSWDEEDLKRQCWFIEASLATLQRAHDHGGVHRVLSAQTTPKDRDTLIHLAESVAVRLHEVAVRGEKDTTWIGVNMARLHEWTLNPLGPDLYDGLPGVILFLAYLGDLTGEARHTDLARQGLAALETFRDAEPLLLPMVGAYSGLGGMVTLYTQLGVLWREPVYLERAMAYAPRIQALVADDTHFDLVAGAAGALITLLRLYQVEPNDGVLAAAVACGEHLLNHATAVDGGVGWLVASMGMRPLTGFSHGTAGIAWALTALADQTGDGRFYETAQAAFAYERCHFHATAGNWPDLRDPALLGQAPTQEPHYETAWCHGAPGVALSRLLSGAFRTDETAKDELATAVATTLRHGFGQNHSLCHGDLGNLDILQLVADATEDRELAATVAGLAAAVVDDIQKHGVRCGIPLSVESPGLMTGLAGIGYGLLRLADPERVPSILALATPVVRDSSASVLVKAGRVGVLPVFGSGKD